MLDARLRMDQLPGGGLVAPVVISMLAVFFITTADSASIVNSQLSQRGDPAPRRMITVFWALCMAGIAVVMRALKRMRAMGGSAAIKNVPPQAKKVFTAAGIFRIVPLEEGEKSDESKTE